MQLYDYMQDVQRFLRDTSQKLISASDLIDYINRARRLVAQQSESIRVLAPISGAVRNVTIVSGGAGYSATPTITISAPDAASGDGAYPAGLQATASVTSAGGIITNVSIEQGGAGYFQPVVTITDPTGSGAALVASTSPVSATEANREVYRFADIPLDNFPGVEQIIAVRGVSFIFANLRYSIPVYPFTTYQAKIRQYPQQYLYVPAMGAQFGQGANGSLYFYPIPSTAYQFECDAQCLPLPLDTNDAVEAIPQPWQDAVAFYAAHLCYLTLQNLNAANYYKGLFDERMHRASAAARPGRSTNPYGRW